MSFIRGRFTNTHLMSGLKQYNPFTRDPDPELDPPVLLVGSYGFLTGPDDDVALLPEKQRSSHTDLPRILPP